MRPGSIVRRGLARLMLPIWESRRAVLLFLGVLALAEVAIRMSGLSTYDGGWNNTEVHEKVIGARSAGRSMGSLDLLVVGSSVGLTADVGGWTRASDNRLRAYNASVPGFRPDSVRFLAENILIPATRPKHILYIVHPRDLNARGLKSAEIARTGYFFSSPAYLSLTAPSFLERWGRSLILQSHLLSTRGQMRNALQKGRPAPAAPFLMDDFGSATMGIGVLEPGPYPPRLREYFLGSGPNRNFSINWEGDLQEILDLHQYAKKHGTKLLVADYPLPPSARETFVNYDRDIATYRRALDHLTSASITVIPPPASLNLTDLHYYDHSHLNREGMAIYARALGMQISGVLGLTTGITTQDLKTAIPDPLVIPPNRLWARLPKPTFVDWNGAAGTDKVMGPLQHFVRSDESFDLGYDVGPGNWLLDVYRPVYGDLAPQSTKPPHLTLIIGYKSRPDHTRTLSNPPIHQQPGTAVSRFRFETDATATLTLALTRVDAPGSIGYEVIDGAYLIPLSAASAIPSPGLPNPQPADVPWSGEVPVPVLAGLDFDHSPPTTSALAIGWKPYTGSQPPWGTWNLVPSDLGGRAARLDWNRVPGSWGNTLIYTIPESVTNRLEGTTLTLTAWACYLSEPEALAGIINFPSGVAKPVYFSKTQAELTPYGHAKKLVGEFYQPTSSTNLWLPYAVTLPVPPKCGPISITLGTRGGAVLMDRVELQTSRDYP